MRLGPGGQRRQGHQDRLHIAAGHQPELGAAVVQQHVAVVEQPGDAEARDRAADARVEGTTIRDVGECIDIKEGATRITVTGCLCESASDSNSGGINIRGNQHVIGPSNIVQDNAGGGIRLGGDTALDGINNDIFMNTIRNNAGGGIRFQVSPQGRVCGNLMTGNSTNSTGTFGGAFDPTGPCT